jgi:hypothetical protein
MATLAVTNDFSAGTTAVAADVNQNFTDVEAFINTSPGVIQNDIVDVKGDIVAATASDAVARVAVGSNDQVLTADSAQTAGVKWAAGGVPATGGTFTGQVTMSDSLYFDGTDQEIVWEGATADAYETFLRAVDPASSDNIITLPDATGTVALQDLAFNNQTASYTLVLADAGKAVEVNNASANTLTVPPNSSVAFPTGTQIIVFQQGAGATTITAGAGVTLRSKDSNLAVDGQYASAALVKRASDEWYVTGALA